MASITGFSFGAFVVEAAFLTEGAAFALGDGTVRLHAGGDTARAFRAHTGAILAATATRDGKLLCGGDDGYVTIADANGTVTPVAERSGKWIDVVAAGPSGTIAYAVGKEAVVRFPDGRDRTFTQD